MFWLSEAVGQTNLGSITGVVVTSDESELTIEGELLGEIYVCTNLTRELSLNVFTVNGNESRTALDVPTSVSTEFASIANVGLSYGCVILVASPALLLEVPFLAGGPRPSWHTLMVTSVLVGTQRETRRKQLFSFLPVAVPSSLRALIEPPRLAIPR